MENNSKERIKNMRNDNPISTEQKQTDPNQTKPTTQTVNRQEPNVAAPAVDNSSEKKETTRISEGLSTTTLNQNSPTSTIHEGGNNTSKINEKFDPLINLQDPTQAVEEPTKKGTMERKDADQSKAEDFDGKLFEEGDIIDWMFRHIIVDGLNYVGKNAVKWVAYGAAYVTDKAVEGVSYVGKETWQDMKEATKWLAAGCKHPDDSTTETFQKVAELHGESLEKSAHILDPKNIKILEAIGGMIREGDFDKLKCFTDQTKAMFKNLSPEQRAETFSEEAMSVMAENMVRNVAAMKQYTANRAASRIMNEKMNDPNSVGKDKEAELFKIYEAEARLEYIIHQKEASKKGINIFESGSQLTALSEQEIAIVKETVQNGAYEERYKNNNRNEKTPINKATKELEQIFNGYKDAKAQYKDGMSIDNFAEEVLTNKDMLTHFEKEIKEKEASTHSRTIDRDKRRAQVRQVVAKSNNPLLARNHTPRNENIAPEKLKYVPQGGRG